MRSFVLICVLSLCCASAAVAKPADLVAGPAEVHPVAGAVGYGEWAARFGNFRNGHVHAGQDVFAPAGTPLVAVRDAVVIETGSDGGRGNYVALYSARDGETHVYFHMRAPARVRTGDAVRAGETVGSVGCTGSCWGDHLHFEIRAGRGLEGRASNPLPRLRSLPRLPA